MTIASILTMVYILNAYSIAPLLGVTKFTVLAFIAAIFSVYAKNEVIAICMILYCAFLTDILSEAIIGAHMVYALAIFYATRLMLMHQTHILSTQIKRYAIMLCSVLIACALYRLAIENHNIDIAYTRYLGTTISYTTIMYISMQPILILWGKIDKKFFIQRNTYRHS